VPGKELLDTQDPHADGGQFDGQGQAVQVPAQLGNGGPVVRCQGEAGGRGRRPLNEQHHRVGPCAVAALQGRQAVSLRLRNGQRGHQEHALAGDVQNLAAGGQQPDAGAGRQQRGGQLRTDIDQVLTPGASACRAETPPARQ
jgi:hypothetical protein